MFHCPLGVWVIEQRAIILSATVRSPTVIFKPWVWTQFDALVVYCSFLIPEKWRPLVDNTKLYLFVCVCVCIYIYNIYIRVYTYKQAHRQQCCRDGCQISERSDNSTYKSHGFETSSDLTLRRVYTWNSLLLPWNPWHETKGFLAAMGYSMCEHVLM